MSNSKLNKSRYSEKIKLDLNYEDGPGSLVPAADQYLSNKNSDNTEEKKKNQKRVEYMNQLQQELDEKIK